MAVSWQRAASEDLVLAEWPALLRRIITPESVARELAATFDRPVVEFGGLIVNHEVNDIERYAALMGWDDDA